MAKVRRDEVIAAALALLDEVGLDGLSTRRLAQRLSVESPALYWHFRDKAALLAEMATSAMRAHHALATPRAPAKWSDWFADNARSFRRALLEHRDGARLHAGSRPSGQDLDALTPKVAYLVSAGLSEKEALLSLRAVGQYTLGSVLEEQANAHDIESSGGSSLANPTAAHIRQIDGMGADVSFEYGLDLLISGIQARLTLRGERLDPTSR